MEKKKFFDESIENMIIENVKNDKNYDNLNKYVISRTKDDIEKMWEIYNKYAPKGFKENMLLSKECFYQRWWEMYLGTKLLEYGFNIITNSRDEGPDFKVCIDDEIYWIEAVAPELGEEESKDKLPEMEMGVHSLPREKFLLRISNAIDNKINKFEKYLEKGLVKKEDKLIIAISTCNLSQYGSLMDFPCLAIDSLVYNKGVLSINIITKEKKIKDQNGIFKQNGQKVETNIFKKSGLNIAGIIYTNDEPLNIHDKIYLRQNENHKLKEGFIKVFCNE